MKRLKKGIDLPVMGFVTEKSITDYTPELYAMRGAVDVHGLKPAMHIKVGDEVKVGQPIYTNKSNMAVPFVAPVSGQVVDIQRGHRRALQSVVIKSDGKNTPIQNFKPIAFETNVDDIINTLVTTGLFTYIRTRPYDNVPNPSDRPDAIFINTMDTNPLALDSEVVIAYGDNKKYLQAGVQLLSILTDGKTFVTAGDGVLLPEFSDHIQVERFSGPHPAGNVGTHIHFLRPVSATKTVWTIGYQDAINIGRFALTGQLLFDRFVAVAGPEADTPAYVKTKVGASLCGLANPNGRSDLRVINGSILTGDAVTKQTAFLGRTTTQVSVMSDHTESRALGWVIPWFDKFSSVLNVHLSAFNRKKPQYFDPALNGSYRALIPVGHLEELTPLDILPSQLMRYVLIGDTDTAQKLGLLELIEEDIALFAYADIGKNDFLGAFRECLAKVEKEG